MLESRPYPRKSLDRKVKTLCLQQLEAGRLSEGRIVDTSDLVSAKHPVTNKNISFK